MSDLDRYAAALHFAGEAQPGRLAPRPAIPGPVRGGGAATGIRAVARSFTGLR